MSTKKIPPLEEDEILWTSEGTLLYQRLAAETLASLKEATPLESPGPDRRRVRRIQHDSAKPA